MDLVSIKADNKHEVLIGISPVNIKRKKRISEREKGPIALNCHISLVIVT
jgi:hypothetical protein